MPANLQQDPVLYGECLSGALYTNDFFSIAREIGFYQPVYVRGRPLSIQNSAIAEKVKHYCFYSRTYRLYRSGSLEASEEDYGQAVMLSSAVDEEVVFEFAEKLEFHLGKVTPVSRNLFKILYQSRFRPYFRFFGEGTTHYGPFVN